MKISNPIFFDVETTGATNDTYGHPFDPRNKLVMVGLRTLNTSFCSSIEFNSQPYGETLRDIDNSFRRGELFVGFNIKFDLHWVRRYGILPPVKIWDCQYAQYCIWRQKRAFPSLDQSLEYWGFPLKLDVVKTEYWDKGIDTDQVDPEVLTEYLQGDLLRTQWVFEAQMKYLEDKPELYKLIVLGNADLLVTQEMEWNGFYYDNAASIKKGQELEAEIADIDVRLSDLFHPVPCDWNSNDFVSAALYGGIVKETYRERYKRVLKSGEIKLKERWSVREHQLPTLVEPLKGTGLAKEGYYSTDEDTLTKVAVKGNKKVKTIIESLLHRSKIEKLKSTYYLGLPKLYESKCWTNDVYHPQLNSCVTRTGRIASQKPNEQNIPDEVRQLIISSYPS